MPVGQLPVLDWTIVPGETARMFVEFWLDERERDPDDVTGDTFEFTVRLGPRDTGDPLVYLVSGTGIDQTDTNVIRLTLTDEQTALIGGCKNVRYGLARNDSTMLEGAVIPHWSVVQGTP